MVARPATGEDRVYWNLYGPVGDDQERLARAARVFERFFPRDALAHARGDALGFHNGRSGSRLVTMDWNAWPAVMGPGGMPFVDLVLSVQRAPYAVFAAEDLTVRLAEAVCPWYGRVLTGSAARAVEGQKVATPSMARIPAPFGLPHLFVDRGRRHPLVPMEVAWINVWSADTCELLGFRQDDERLFSSARVTSRGTRVLSLTTLPLDPAGHPDHVDALRAVYDRFPRIGCRA